MDDRLFGFEIKSLRIDFREDFDKNGI